MVKVVFTKDYATKQKGDSMEVDSMLARNLINKKVAKVAKVVKKKKQEDKD